MSNFDQMLNALREDCDDGTTLANAADLRHLGSRRTLAYRAAGGVATLAVAAGVTTGIVLLAGTPPTAKPIDPAASGGVVQAATTPAVAPTAATASPTTATPPLTKPHTVTPHSGTPACVDTKFDVNHPTVVPDSAAGIIGYDIQLRYDGKATCKLSQPPRVYYTTVNGETLPFAIDSAHSHPKSAPPITVKPGRTVYVTVYGVDGRNTTPTPPGCTATHLYKGLAVAIDGKIIGLMNATMSFPCAGPVSMTWNLL